MTSSRSARVRLTAPYILVALVAFVGCGGEEPGPGSGGATSASSSAATTAGGTNCLALDADACAARTDCVFVATKAPDACGRPAAVRCYSTARCDEPAGCASGQECLELVHGCAADCASCDTVHVCSDIAGHD